MTHVQVVFAVGAEGRRPDLPQTLQPEVSRLIQDCWSALPNERPLFSDVIQRLKDLEELKWLAVTSMDPVANSMHETASSSST